MSTDDEIELPGESELYDLWIDAQAKAVAIAEKLDLTNEDLERIEARWKAIGNNDTEHNDGHAMARLARYVLTIRTVSGLAALMKPGEEMVPLVELAARARQKGDA
jgi:hypothetical protein